MFKMYNQDFFNKIINLEASQDDLINFNSHIDEQEFDLDEPFTKYYDLKFIIKAIDKYNNKEMIEFYRIMFKSKPFISLLNTFTNTIRDGKDISFKDISRVELPIPDKKFLNDFYKRVKIYRITVSNFEKIRKLLIEYKTRLISDAVTGKIKV